MNTQASPEGSHRGDLTAEGKIIPSVPEANKKSYGNDSAYAIRICRRFFTVLGLWPMIDAGVFFWRTVLGHMSVIACYFSIGIRAVPTGLYLILDEKRPNERLRLIIRCAFVFMTGMKYTLLRSHRRNIEKCMNHIEQDWLQLECTRSRDIMLEHAQFGHLLTRICTIFTYVGATFLAIMLPILATILRDDKAHNINITETVSVRKFAVASHFGHSVFSQTPIYEFIYSSQVIGTYVLHSVTIACYSLGVVIVMHACGQLNILMGKLHELVDGGGIMTTHESVDNRMFDIIKHHVRTLRFITSAEKMLRAICLFDLGGYTFEVCGTGYFWMRELQAETKNPIAIIGWTVLFVTFTFYIFSLCYISELLSQACIRVGEVTYMIDWYRLPGKKSLDLGLIITMAQSPVSLTAGGSIPLSMRCFATVMRTAFGYLNMIRTVLD